MTVNSLIGGSSTLQNELLKLLGGTEENENENNDNEVHKKSKKAKQVDESKQNNENMELENIIKDSINKQNIEDAKYVNSDMTGGTNIVGLVENILAGGNLNNTNESEIKDTSNNAMISGEDIIGNILIEGGDNKSSTNDLDSELDKLSESYDASENGSDSASNYMSDNTSDNMSDSESDNKYIKIINEMKMFNESNDSITLTGGNSQHVQHVKVLNMFPWILKS